MALMTPEERLPYTKRGYYPKYKCDSPACGKAIMSPVSYTGERGSYCSLGCLNAAESPGLRGGKRKEEEPMKDVNTKTKKRPADDGEAEENTNMKSTKKSSKDKTKKKPAVEEAPKKKKKPAADEATPKKKTPAYGDAPKDDIPFRSESGIGRVFRMMMDGGAQRSKVEAFCEKHSIDLKWALTHIGKGTRQLASGTWTWKLLKKDDGRLKIVKLTCN